MQLLLGRVGILCGLLAFLFILLRVRDSDVGQIEGIGAKTCLGGVQHIKNDRHDLLMILPMCMAE